MIRNENDQKQEDFCIPMVISTLFLNFSPQFTPITCICNPILVDENLACQKNLIENCIIDLDKKDKNEKSLSQSSNQKKFRKRFTKEEDEKIRKLVDIFGTDCWTLISQFVKGRSPKQIRDRYSNYLMPGIFFGEWTQEEDELLVKLFSEYGSKWSFIHDHFPNRSANSIKNRWYYFLSKKHPNKSDIKKSNCSDNQKNSDCKEIENCSSKKHFNTNGNLMDDVSENDMLGDLSFEEWY